MSQNSKLVPGKRYQECLDADVREICQEITKVCAGSECTAPMLTQAMLDIIAHTVLCSNSIATGQNLRDIGIRVPLKDLKWKHRT